MDRSTRGRRIVTGARHTAGTGRFDAVDRQSINIHSVLDQVKAVAKAGFGRNIRITENYDPSLPPVFANRDQLVQVFQNLIENALKYGGSGGYLGVTMRRIDHEPQLRGPAWAVEIRDRGEGIEGMHLPRLT